MNIWDNWGGFMSENLYKPPLFIEEFGYFFSFPCPEFGHTEQENICWVFENLQVPVSSQINE